MTKHAFVLKLDAAPGLEPQVRMWIDLQSSDLASEQEVELVRDGAAAWSGAFHAQGPFTYRIGIVAAPGSRWALEFTTAGDHPEELLFDSDELTMTKEWLLGTCEAMVALRESQRFSREAC